MVRLIQARNKELQQLRKQNEDQKVLLQSSKRENRCLARNMDIPVAKPEARPLAP